MKRILTDIRIGKISAVDAPAVEGAVVTIMKRNGGAAVTSSSFERIANDICRRDRCSRTEAMSKARRESPTAFSEMQSAERPRGSSRFEKLVAKDMARGCSYEVAAQRAIQKGAARIAPDGTVDDDWSGTGDTSSADGATDEFENLVHQHMISRGVNRQIAYQRVARERPDLVQKMRV